MGNHIALAIGLVGVMIAGALVVLFGGFLPTNSLTNPANAIDISQLPQQVKGIPANTDFKFLPVHNDKIAQTALAEDTNAGTVVITVDVNSPTGFALRQAATTSAITLPMKEADNGIVYFAAEALSGQAYALDPKSLETNVVFKKYMDWDNDFNKEWTMGVDTSQYYSAVQLSGQPPTVSPVMNWYKVGGAVTLTAPADTTSVGTSQILKHAAIKVSGTTKTIQMYDEIRLTFNSTATDDWDESQSFVETPFGRLYLNENTDKFVSTTTVYVFDISKNQQEAIENGKYVTLMASESVDRYDDLALHLMFDGSEQLGVAIVYTTHSATDGPQASSSITAEFAA